MSRRRALARRLLQSPALEEEALAWLGAGARARRAAGENPLLLTLLLGYVRHHARLPEHLFALFDATVTRRLEIAAPRMSRSSGVDPDLVMRVAEAAAFSVATDHALGLEVSLVHEPLRRRHRSDHRVLGTTRLNPSMALLASPACTGFLAAGVGRADGLDPVGHSARSAGAVA